MAATAYSPNVAPLPRANVATLPTSATAPLPSPLPRVPRSNVIPFPGSNVVPFPKNNVVPFPSNNVIPFPKNPPPPPIKIQPSYPLLAKTNTPVVPRMIPALIALVAIALLASEALRRQGEWGKRSFEGLINKRLGEKPFPASPFPSFPIADPPSDPRIIGSLNIQYIIRSEANLEGYFKSPNSQTLPIRVLSDGSPSIYTTSAPGPIIASVLYWPTTFETRMLLGYYCRSPSGTFVRREHISTAASGTNSAGGTVQWKTVRWNITATPVVDPSTLPSTQPKTDPDELPQPEEIPDVIPQILPPGIPDPIYPDPPPEEDDPKIPDRIPQKLPPGLPDKEPPSFPKEDEPPQPDEEPEEPLPGIPPIEPEPREPEPREPEEPEPDILPPAITPQPLPSLPQPTDDPDKIPYPFPSIPNPVPDESPIPIPSLPVQPQPGREDTPEDVPFSPPSPVPNPLAPSKPTREPSRIPSPATLPGQEPATPNQPNTSPNTPTIPLSPEPFPSPTAPPFSEPTTPGIPPFHAPIPTPQPGTPTNPNTSPGNPPFAPSPLPGTPNQPLPAATPSPSPDMPFPSTVSPPLGTPQLSPPFNPPAPITPPKPCTCAPSTSGGENMSCRFDINAIRTVVRQELEQLEKAVGVTEFPKVLPVLAKGGFKVVQNLIQLNEWIKDNISSVAGTFPTTLTFPNDGNPSTVKFDNIATALEKIYIALNSGDMVDVEIKVFTSCKTEQEAKEAKKTNSIIKTQTYGQDGMPITDPNQLPLVSETANFKTKTIKVPRNQAQLVRHYFDEMFRLQSQHCEQQDSIINRIYKILGGDKWFKKGKDGKLNYDAPSMNTQLDATFKKIADAAYLEEGDPPREKEKELEVKSLIEYINTAIAHVYHRGGYTQFPTEVAETMLTYSDDGQPLEVTDFSTYFAWFLTQFDLLMGQFPIQIKIEDTDLAKEGNQSLTVEMPNLSEALAETYGLAVSASANADLAINFLMRLASEVIATKNATLITQDYAKANASFLGYRANPKAREVDYSFNPSDMSAFDKFLQNSKGKIVGWSEESKETLIDYLQRLMFSAGIIKAVFMRNKDQVKQLKKELESLMTNPEDDKAWKEFIEQINNPRSIFNQGNNQIENVPPQFLDNKPVVKPEEEKKKDGKGN